MKKAKSIVLCVLIVAVIGGFYFYIANMKTSDKETVITQVQDVLLRNLETDYPPTQREVVKYYNDIIKCVYNDSYTQDQFAQMTDKLLGIYDTDLVENNPKEQYTESLNKDVKDFRNNGYTIVSYTVSSSTDVEEFTQNGRQCAKLYCTYSVRRGSDYVSSRQVFILRKEVETGHWKILGFNVETQES